MHPLRNSARSSSHLLRDAPDEHLLRFYKVPLLHIKLSLNNLKVHLLLCDILVGPKKGVAFLWFLVSNGTLKRLEFHTKETFQKKIVRKKIT